MKAIKEFSFMVLTMAILFGGILFLFDGITKLLWMWLSK